MPKRHADAVGVQRGGFNLSGVAHSLAAACDEAHAYGVEPSEDFAVRLIAYRLYLLCGGSMSDHNLNIYSRLIAECERSSSGTTDAKQKP
jgi:hypothetical protein